MVGADGGMRQQENKNLLLNYVQSNNISQIKRHCFEE